MRYRKYIASHAWRRNPARRAELRASRGHCRLCFGHSREVGRLEVHHATYVRLTREIQGDLIALCRSCHREVTSFLRRRRYADRRPIRNDVVALRDLRYRLVDPTR